MSKLDDAEAEAAETQTWVDFAVSCGYLCEHDGDELNTPYDNIIGKLVAMITNPKPWLLTKL